MIPITSLMIKVVPKVIRKVILKGVTFKIFWKQTKNFHQFLRFRDHNRQKKNNT
jgi:hypothetical protein